MGKISDKYFIKTILNTDDFFDNISSLTLNGWDTSRISNILFNKENANTYYTALKKIFDWEEPYDGHNHGSMVIFNPSGTSQLYILFDSSYVRCDTPYSKGIRFNSPYYYIYDIENDTFSTIQTLSMTGTDTVNVNNDGILFSSVPVCVWQNSNFNTVVDYARIMGDQGVGSGGWQVPNPNPTRKIVINGSEPDDIKLNGVTPDKIMLNGQCYFEKPLAHNYLYKWNFTKSNNPLIDEINKVEITKYSTARISIDTGGLHNNHAAGYVEIPIPLDVGKTYEIVIGEIDCKVTNTNGKFLTHKVDGVNKWDWFGYRKVNNVYTWLWSIDSNFYDFGILINDFSNSTLKIVIGSQLTNIYLNDVLIGSSNTIPFSSYTYETIRLFGDSGSQGYFDATIKEFNVYENEE